jgi:glucose 1-dehydrogenase
MAENLLSGQVAVVTGAAADGGIGAAIACAFADHGAALVLGDIDAVQGEALAERLRVSGARAHFVETDVTNSQSVRELVAAAVGQFGKLDVAVNGAARLPDDHEVSDLDEDLWRGVIDVNLTGVAICMKYELQQMIRQGRGGSVINISSVRAHKPFPRRPAYVAAKHGLVGLTKTAAVECGPHRIRVNAVAPGSIDTPMLQESVQRFRLDAAAYAAQAGVFNRFGRPEEVADACVFLASDRSTFVTGSTLHVDAGFAMT